MVVPDGLITQLAPPIPSPPSTRLHAYNFPTEGSESAAAGTGLLNSACAVSAILHVDVTASAAAGPVPGPGQWSPSEQLAAACLALSSTQATFANAITCVSRQKTPLA